MAKSKNQLDEYADDNEDNLITDNLKRITYNIKILQFAHNLSHHQGITVSD